MSKVVTSPGSSNPIWGVAESTLLRTIFEQAGVGIELVAPDGRLLRVNPALCCMLGYSERELLEKTFREITHTDDLGREEPSLEALLRGECGHYEIEKRYLHRNGSPVWVAVTSSVVRNGNGLVLYRISVVQNITERKLAEAALKKSEEKFSKAFQRSPMALVLATAGEDRFIDVNETFERLTGYSRQEAIGRTSMDLGLWENPDDLRHLTDLLFSRYGTLRDVECRFRVRDGSIRVGLLSAEAMDLNGETCTLSVVADITDLKRAEEEFRLVIEAAPSAMVAVNSSGEIVLVNTQAEKTFGYERGELLDKPVEILLPEQLRKHHIKLRNDFLATLRARSMGQEQQLYGRRKNGESFPIEIGLNPIETATGTWVLSSIVDITERKRWELAIRESEERFRLVANTAPVLIWMSGPDKLCTYFNRPWLDFTGRPLEAELGNGWAEGVHPDDRERCFDTYSKAFDRGQPFRMEYRLRRRDGEYRWVLDIGVPRVNPDGSLGGYIGSCVDVTERKMAEEALRTVSGRLIEAQEAERSRIARELHDDINQRLAVLALEIDALKSSSLDAPDRIDGLFKATLDISSGVQALSHQLHSSKLEYLGVVAAMRSFCSEFGQQHNVDVDFSCQKIPASLPYDISLCLFRILQEALRNALKHSGVRHFKANLQYENSSIQLTVSDSGLGFDAQSAMRGTGLGLVSMQERVKLVKGTISIVSKSNFGTEITARVPVAAETSKRKLRISA